MNKIIIANWKMNPAKASVARKLAQDIKKQVSKIPLQVVICPPLAFIEEVKGSGKSKRVYLGAQDVFYEKEGSFTGEVSATQLKSVGVTHVIIGHSERRALGETSEIVAKKVVATIKARLVPVICIGENERHGDGKHWHDIKIQLEESLNGVSRTDIGKCIITYEPVWAISKKGYNAMKSEDVSESIIYVRKILADMYGAKVAHRMRIIYGGSVNGENAKDIAQAGAEGFLVGHASLSAKNFTACAEALK